VNKRVPPDCVSIGAKNLGIAFCSMTVKPWKLAEYQSVNVLIDERRPLVVGLQFIEDRAGDYKTDRYRGTNLMVRCAALLRRWDIKPGLYSAQLDRPGFVIVDFGLRIER